MTHTEGDYMVEAILTGLIVTVLGGLILYHFFGVGKTDSKSTKNSKNKISGFGNIVGDNNNVKISTRDVSIKEKDSGDTKESKNNTKSSPMSLVDEVKKQPPYLRAAASESYTGLKIEWSVYFHTILEAKNDIAELMLSQKNGYPWVYCEINLSDYPELKSMQEGVRLIVQGTIKSVKGHDIHLTNAALKL